jgi:hypothetical protein
MNTGREPPLESELEDFDPIRFAPLTGKQYSVKLCCSDEFLGEIREKFGDVEDAFRRATGYGFDFLTESEARALVKFHPADAVRSSIFAEGNEKSIGVDEEGTGESLNLGSSAEEDTAAVEKALASMNPIHRAVFEAVNSGMTPEQVMAKYSISLKAVSNILDQVRSRIASVMKATTADRLTPAMRDGKFDGGRPDLALSTIRHVVSIDQIRHYSGLPEARENRGANILAFKTLRMTMNDTMCRGRHGVSHQKSITAI